MPVEIKELVIRAVVQPGSGEDVKPSDADSSEQQQEVIQACVREVLRILKRAEER